MAAILRLQTADGTVVADHVEAATTLWPRFRGLMWRDSLPDGHGLVLRPCSSIHMFFMRFPLDAVFVDADGVVVRIYAGIRPWRLTGIVRRAKSCIELPAGTCMRAGVGVGDRVQLTPG